MSGAKKSSSISTGATAITAPRWPRPSSITARAAPSAKSRRSSASPKTSRADLASGVWGSWGSNLSEATGAAGQARSLQSVDRARRARHANELIGFPRHLSQHVGGFVLTNDRLDEFVPISPATMEDRHFIEWDKDDIDAVQNDEGRCARPRHAHLHPQGVRSDPVCMKDKTLRSATCPRMIRRSTKCCKRPMPSACFQVESRAQMSMLPRMKPEKFYDLVIEVAIVRPGPIQGGMVHPYLRRRAKLEEVVFPSPSPEHGPPDELHSVLGKDAGRSFVPRTGDEARHRRGKIHTIGSERPAPCDGDVPQSRHHRYVQGQVHRRHDPARLCSSISQNAASSRSKVSALMAFPKAMPRASRCSFMCRPISRNTIRQRSPAHCSIRNRWDSMRRRRSCAMRANTISKCDTSM